MKVHNMRLNAEPFVSIKAKRKTVEVRLNDKKRSMIKVGDIIEFMKVPEEDERIKVEVLELRKYDTFKEMYESIPFKYFDCEDWTLEGMIEETYKVYSPEQEKKWGTLAISIKVIDSSI